MADPNLEVELLTLYGPLLDYCRRLTRHHSFLDARDICQIAIERARGALHPFDVNRGVSLKTWLFTIANRVAFNMQRDLRPWSTAVNKSQLVELEVASEVYSGSNEFANLGAIDPVSLRRLHRTLARDLATFNVPVFATAKPYPKPKLLVSTCEYFSRWYHLGRRIELKTFRIAAEGIAAACKSKEIGESWGISSGTVDAYVSRIWRSDENVLPDLGKLFRAYQVCEPPPKPRVGTAQLQGGGHVE